MDLKSILKLENVSIIDKQLEWKESIYLATKPLVEQKFVEERYPEEIIKNTYEFGPYYILVDDVAFLHTRPEQGVIEDQISVLLDKQTVHFKEDESKGVKLFIVFAAKGSEGHIQIMGMIAEILSDEEKLNKIIKAKSEKEIYDLIFN